MNRELHKGEIVVIEDHINLMGVSPLEGANIDDWGPRFPDMSRPYDKGFRERLLAVAGSEGTLPLSEMVTDFAATQSALEAGLAGLTDEYMAAKAPFSPGNNEKETVGSLLAGLVFHEGYNVGQLGILRRLAGADGALK